MMISVQREQENSYQICGLEILNAPFMTKTCPCNEHPLTSKFYIVKVREKQ